MNRPAFFQHVHLRSALTLLIVFLIFMSTVIVVCEIWVFQASSSDIERMVINDRAQGVRMMANEIQANFNNIRLQCFNSLIDSSSVKLTQKLADSSFYDTIFNIREVMDNISSKIIQYNMISSFKIYFPSLGKCISNTSAKELSPEELSELYHMMDEAPDGVYADRSGVHMWTSYPFFFMPTSKQASRISVVSINTSQFKKLIYDYKEHLPDSEFFITYRDGILTETGQLEWALPYCGASSRKIRHGSGDYYMIGEPIDEGSLYLYSIIPVENILRDMNSVTFRLRLLLLFSGVLMVAFVVLLYRTIYRPLHQICDTLKVMGDGHLNVHMPRMWASEFQMVSDQFNAMSESIQTLIAKEYEYKLLVQQVELKQLRHQISPHFLYNTYFQLRGLITIGDTEDASILAGLLGKYLRYIVHNDQDTASLYEEFDHARAYADIQQMRFRGKVDVVFSISIDEDAMKRIQVPRLIIQPLIENAFTHGMKDTLEGGVIQIGLSLSDDYVDVIVEDNGDILTEESLAALQAALREEKSSMNDSVALINIHRRIGMMMGAGSGLVIGKSELGGMKADLHIARKDR